MLGDSLRRRRRGRGAEGSAEPAPRPRPSRPRFTVWHWLLAALVILGGSFVVGYLLSTQVLFPRPDTAGAGTPVPSLYGDTRAEAEAALREAGLDVGEVRELASMSMDPGRVLAQTPIPGQQLRAGGAVSLAVSGGPPEVRVPPLVGMTEESARGLLDAAGFDVQVRPVDAPDAPVGLVLGTEPDAGTPRRLPAAVTLLIAAPTVGEPVGRRVPPVGALDALRDSLRDARDETGGRR